MTALVAINTSLRSIRTGAHRTNSGATPIMVILISSMPMPIQLPSRISLPIEPFGGGPASNASETIK